ncbi:MAG TPA: M1 family aminopeptidase [bacterium]
MKYICKQITLVALLVGVLTGIAAHAADVPLPYRIKHHDLTIELDLLSGALTAQDQITLSPEPTAAARLDLLLRRGLAVKGVHWGKKLLKFNITDPADPQRFETEVDSEDVNFYNKAQMISIEIPQKAAKESELVLTISYEGIVKDSLGDGDFSREYVAMQVTGIISPQGVYLGPEGIFYPTLPQQLFTYSLTLTLPEQFQSVSEGIDEATTIHNGKRTETWTCKYPVDGFHLIANRFDVKTIEHEGVKISTYFFPDTTDLAQRYLKACADYITLYNGLLGKYPFEKFAVVENFMATGYGMPSFTLLGSEVLRLPFIISTSLGHEICHNWWGNSVYVDYQSGNWCEGLTTYCADYLYKERKSPADAREYRMGLLRDYLAYAHEGNDFALGDFVTRHNPAQRAVGYGKSAMLYHMLRKWIGDDLFWKSLQRFYKDNVFHYASWTEVRKAFEAEIGNDLRGFFEQWVNRTGGPQLALESPGVLAVGDRWQLLFTLAQTQNEDNYMLRVPVRIMGDNQDTTIIWPLGHEKNQDIRLEVSFKPASLSVDPNFDLFRRLDKAEIAPTLSEVLGAPDLIIVLPTKAAQDMQDAYAALAEKFKGEESPRILKDSELKPEDLNGAALFFLGAPVENTAIPADWITAKNWALSPDGYHLLGIKHSDPGTSLLAVERHPRNAESAIAFYCARRASDIQEAGRKLPHYGKYSYLVFYGGKNQVKGVWEITSSPLIHAF